MQSMPQTAFLEVPPFIQHLPGSSSYSALISRQTGAGLSPSGSPKQHTLYQIQNNTRLTLNTTTVQNVQLDMHSMYPRQWEISHTWIFGYIWICSSHSLDQQTCTVGGEVSPQQSALLSDCWITSGGSSDILQEEREAEPSASRTLFDGTSSRFYRQGRTR